jgi:hypothetical protein
MFVAEWHELTDENLRESICAGRQPVILRGLVRHWRIVVEGLKGIDALTDYLLQFDQGKSFQAMIAPASVKGRLFYKADLSGFNFDRMNGELREALNILKALSAHSPAPGFYIGSKVIPEYLPGLERETRVHLLDEDVDPTIWMGNTITVATHNDDSENIACVAVGHRRFTLFPPGEEPNLYMGPADMTPAGRPISLVDLHSPDFEKFPRFRQALNHVQVAELGPGDALYIPTHWWHHVQALDSVNILVNFWWRGAPPNFALLARHSA